MKKLGIILIISAALGAACDPDADLPALQDVYKGVFDVGAAVEPEQVINPGRERDVFIRHFSSLTPENAMKWLSIHPTEDTWNFGPADQLVAFAQKEGKKVRGHCLIWHHPEQTADWMFTDKDGQRATRELMLKRMETHIKTVVGHFKGRVFAWDVVNEPIDTGNDDLLRHTQWYTLIGPDYMEYALRYAHEADPDALLFINDDNTQELKRIKALTGLVAGLKAKGVPLDGLGMEMHIANGRPRLEAIAASIKKYRELGLVLHVTELDMSLYRQEFEKLDAPPASYLIHQAHRYQKLFDLFRANADVITNVTFWGFQDGHTWLRRTAHKRLDWPLLFDDNVNAKLAFKALVAPETLPADDEWLQSIKPAPVYQAPPGTPVMDGKIDEVWARAPIISTAVYALGTDGAKAKVRLLWDEKHLYVLAEVADPLLSDKASQAHEKDSFEVFLDENNGKTPSFEGDDYQFRVNFRNQKSWAGSAREKYFDTAVAVTDSGYVAEMAITFQTVAGEAGARLGLELQVNDDNGAGRRTGISKWFDPTNESWRDTSGWGVLELGSSP